MNNLGGSGRSGGSGGTTSVLKSVGKWVGIALLAIIVLLFILLIIYQFTDEAQDEVPPTFTPTITSTPTVTMTPWVTFTPLPTSVLGIPAAVVRVVSGDRIEVQIEGQQEAEVVGYRYLIAPPTYGQLGDEAARSHRLLVGGQKVYLGHNPDRSNPVLTRYDVYLKDGTWVNEELVKLGYTQWIGTSDIYNSLPLESNRVFTVTLVTGEVVEVTPTPKVYTRQDLAQAQAQAQADMRGIWRYVDVVREAQVYLEPSTTSEAIGVVQAGSLVEIRNRLSEGDWYQLANNGWIEAAALNNEVEQAPLVYQTATPTVTPTPTVTQTPIPSTPTQTLTPTPTETPHNACLYCSRGDLYDCNDFSSQVIANNCFLHCWSTVNYDVHNLDTEGNRPVDNVVCEDLPVTVEPTATPKL
ncbi:MAG: hypothetical protein AAF639_06065 [Chloroflexota bacterium]